MLSSILIILPLLASSVTAQPHHVRSPGHASHPRELTPLAIYNNALLSERSNARGAGLLAPQPEPVPNPAPVQDGKRLVRRKKKRACKAAGTTSTSAAEMDSTASASTSIIGNGALATGASASASTSTSSAAATATPTSTDSEAWYYYTSALASASSAAGSDVSSASASAPASSATTSASNAKATSSVTPSTASSSSAPAASSSAASGGSSKSSMLFPVGRGTASWTTDPEESGALSISDALKPLSAGKLPTEGSAPDGSDALVANFPAGTVKLASGQGFSFYTEGSKNGVYAPGATEVVFSYSAFFEDGFEFNKGGKMPGFFGGTSFDTAKSCSGGKQDGREECFSARLMWRTDGMGEAYNYYPTSVTQANNYCNTAPKSVCDVNYGDSIGRGSFYWGSGKWTTVAQRLKLNDAGQANGEQEIFIDGQSVLHLTELQIRTNADTKIYGIMAQTFFGGSDSTWASPRDQNIWFKDFSMAIIA